MEDNNEDETPGIFSRGIQLESQVKDFARKLAEKLNKDIAAGHTTGPFFVALMVAVFKDFLDIFLVATGAGEIPGVSFLISAFVTTFLFFFMFGKGYFLRWKFQVMYWIVGLFIDGLPLVSALPMSTILVLYAWRLAKKRADKAEGHLEDLSKKTSRDIANIEEDMDYEIEAARAQYSRPTFRSADRGTRYAEDEEDQVEEDENKKAA